jgi:peptidoglycan/LPS O-acetylase OafA/YrhL
MDKLLAPGVFRLFLAYVVVLHHLSIICFGGWAVFVFFILSGYWITEVWLKKYDRMKHAYLQFVVSRYLRLLPVYLSCFLSSLMILKLTVADFTTHYATWWLKLVSIVFADAHTFFLPPMWSIIVEIKFYLLAPFLIWMVLKVVRRDDPRARPVVRGFLAVVLIAIALLSLKPFLHFSNPDVSGFLLYFLLGILINVTGYLPSKKVAVASLAAVFLVAALSFISDEVKNVFGPEPERSVDEFRILLRHYLSGSLAVLVAPYVAYSVRVRSEGLDRELGNLSYSLYLFHFCIVFLFNNVPQLAHLPVALRVTLSITAMSLGALAIYCLVDRPMEKLRKKWFETWV